MSAINGDKARYHRERKAKEARRQVTRALAKKIAAGQPVKPTGANL